MPGVVSSSSAEFAEVTVVPVATAGPCTSPCKTIFPFLILLFFMTFVVAVTQMPLLMIVLRSVGEEERSFALGMQFVIFRLFGYIPAPILFGNLIDSTCLLWKSTCGEKGGRCLIYDIEQFRYRYLLIVNLFIVFIIYSFGFYCNRYVGLCAGIKVLALALFLFDWWLVKKRTQLEEKPVMTAHEAVGSIISLNKLFEEKSHNQIVSDDDKPIQCSTKNSLSLKIDNNDDESAHLTQDSMDSSPTKLLPHYSDTRQDDDVDFQPLTGKSQSYDNHV